ncbi:phage portal protein [Lysinibacillus sphaericus]|uniref:Phage portal protein, SPP1 family n=1 Tax=Lysinibacillus sphaericus OT4b.31 TaxID=1285586 RepID=R7ZDR7_LYSSH|nr:phage portal protein [Lysinibacillus sphaericus]EON72243.1 phage portal protein, SPP1 family [Lysinibacillus sphaericus OT4b.31]
MFQTTHTDELIAFIEANKPAPTAVIKEIYNAFDTSKMIEGIRYYNGESAITIRKIYKYENGVKIADDDARNEKIVSGFHKILVDQKTAYLVGEPMSFGSKSDNQIQLEFLEEIIGEKWEDTIPELIKNASNKGKEWLHPFVNETGDFSYMIIPAENFIPIYDKKTHALAAGVYFYAIDSTTMKMEVWTDEDVTYFEMIEGEVYIDASEEVNPAPHFTNAEGNEWRKWGKVPFIKFANNQEELGDLHYYKSIIDTYDELLSDAQNTLLDMQSVIYALIGYEGESLKEFTENMKRYKAVNLDENGDMKIVRAEVPVDAYKNQQALLKENIYAFGQGVNPSPDVIGDAPSGVALENLYSLLDMKASILERKFTLALRDFMWFISEYCDQAKKGDFDYRDVTFNFNKMLLTNEAEIVQMARDSNGIISTTTILENHPWVRNVAQEQIRLDQDAKLYGRDLEPLDDK